ncbi:MAG: protein-glutamate O-methyltransferase CheR [Lachnospiraceae bacterium]|nr:protein-glutamate O-methyltransferase CheR [Lachnospiraceae bacterium]
MDNFNFKPAYSSINPDELELFRKYLCAKSGILIPPEKAYMFETRLSKMIVDVGVDSFKELYDYCVSGVNPQATQKIINAMTTNETLWFRDTYAWKVIEERLLPQLIEQLRSGVKKRIRIWSAAVSTGQEMYSTVMCIDNYLKKNNICDITLADFEFLATDISSRVLEIAQKGRYDAISIMRGLSDHYRTRYFVSDHAAWNLDRSIRDAVNFKHFNLLNSYLGFGTFDIIFCRYVLIYFSDDLKKAVITKMHDQLNEKGTFFTGNYALYDLFEDNFNADYYEKLTYYTKK